MSKFVGRQAELGRLVETTRKKSASFVIVKGRRRVGKSRLIQEFAKQFDHYYVFAGLPPEKKYDRQASIRGILPPDRPAISHCSGSVSGLERRLMGRGRTRSVGQGIAILR